MTLLKSDSTILTVNFHSNGGYHLHERGANIMSNFTGVWCLYMQDPGIKIEPGYEAYDEGIEKDVFVKQPNGVDYAVGEVIHIFSILTSEMPDIQLGLCIKLCRLCSRRGTGTTK